MRNHYLKHWPEKHICCLCNKEYTRKDNLNSHYKRDHAKKGSLEMYAKCGRISKKMEEYHHQLKSFTPDVYSPIKFSATSTNTLSSRGSSLQSQPSPVAAPMDLSLRPLSVPIHAQYPPILSNFYPSIYGYTLADKLKNSIPDSFFFHRSPEETNRIPEAALI